MVLSHYVKHVPFSDLATKTLRMFLSLDTLNTQKNHKQLYKKLNNETGELLGKLSQISKLDGPNKNIVSCDYYNLMISRK